MEVSIRYELARPRRGVVVIRERLGAGARRRARADRGAGKGPRREYLAPRGGFEVSDWTPAASELAELAELPRRLVELNWPITTKKLREIVRDFGLLLNSVIDAERAGLQLAVEADTLRLLIHEYRTAIALLDASRRAGSVLQVPTQANRYGAAPWLEQRAVGTSRVWFLRTPAPLGLAADPMNVGLGAEHHRIFRRERDGTYRSALSTNPNHPLPSVADAARFFLRELFGAAFKRWVQLHPGDGSGQVEVVISSPLGIAWYQLANAPVLVQCERCERVFQRNPRLKHGNTRFGSEACQKYVLRKRPKVLALHEQGSSPEAIAHELGIEERLVERIITAAGEQAPTSKKRS